ncbi:MAG: hypothetical protein NC418_11840 [Muribaculaceae bacterium]|nr:hypothetical protein [Muribaculaceae bacterium]
MDSLSFILSLCTAVLGCSTLVGWLLYGKAMRRTKDAEAAKAEAEAAGAHWERYEKQLDHANATIATLHKQIERDAERISQLNGALDGKTDRIRELTDKLIESERALNEANARIVRLTEERDRERLMKEKYKEWHCRSNVCQPGNPDPNGRVPPNPNLIGKRFSTKDK